VDASVETRDRARKAGFDDYLSKPALQRDLIAKILQMGRRGTGPMRLAPPVSMRPDDETLPDWIIAQYVASLVEQRQLLLEAEKQGDTRTLKFISHRLAGSGTSYGFPDITDCAKSCEQALDDGAPPSTVASAFVGLITALEEGTKGVSTGLEGSAVVS
jgi:HPt (histidine-containing phosphotransfer) domain-containing protein